MKTGYVHAVAALLVASGWAAAQAPLPISYSESRAPAAQAAEGPGLIQPVAYQKEEPLRVQPVPASTPVATGPTTNVVPYGGYVDSCDSRQCCVYADAEFLMWRIRNGHVPTFTAQPPVGVLTVQTFDYINTVASNGSLSTTVQPGVIGYFPLRIQDIPALPNDGTVRFGEHTGGRFALGAWTPDHLFGMEASFFFLERRSQDLSNAYNTSNNQLLYTTPFVDREFTVTPAQGDSPPTRTQTGSFPIFFVRQLDSTINAHSSDSMWGGVLNARSTSCYFGQVAIGGLAGFRYNQFKEQLDVAGNFSLFTPDTVVPVTDAFGQTRPDNLPATILLQTRDSVSARNYFYGGNVGADFDGLFGKFFVNLRTQVAMGGMHQRLDIASSTTTSTSATTLVPAGSTTIPGGLLFNQLDSGTHKRDRISFIPELNLKAGCQFYPWMRGWVGYDVMYISNVARPGDVSLPLATSSTLQNSTAPTSVSSAPASTTGITNVSVSQPGFRFNDSNIWTQGFNFGLELSF